MDKNDLLAKWLNNNCTREELEILKSSKEYSSYLKIAEVTSQIKIPEFNKEANFKAINSKKNKSKSRTLRLNSINSLLKIAAVFTLLFFGYQFFNSSDTNITTQIAEKQTFLLPDKSEVILNANSNIGYNKSDWSRNRELTLEGEAYFKVNKGQKFNVLTKEGIVSVLGTQFNVKIRDRYFYINCYEGLVSVTFNDTIIKIPAGQKIKIEDGVLVKHNNINSQNPTWINNESSFNNATLNSVINEFERQYPVKISSTNIDLNQHFSGSFSHKNIELALKLICDPLNISYTIVDKENIILYAKEK